MSTSRPMSGSRLQPLPGLTPSTLATIRRPTLVLTGDQDNIIPNSFSREMAAGIAGAKLVVLADCGHLPQLEQPAVTMRALA